MAKINTVFSLTDEVTNPLKRIQNQVRNMTGGFDNLSMKLLGVNQALQLATIGFENLKKAGGIFATLVSEAGSAQSIISKLTVALGDSQKAVEKFKDIQNFASVTPFDVEGTAQAYIMLKNAGMETEELLPMIRMIGDLAQGNNQAFNNMALNMMQIKASGQATAMDLRQFSTFGVPISQALKEIGRDGDKSFDAVLQAMIHLTSEGGKFYNSMSMGALTLEGRMANLQDSLQQLKATMGQTMLPLVQQWQGAFANFFENLKNWFNNTLNYNNRISKFFDGLYNKLDSLVATIIYLGTITTVVAGIMATAWAVANWPLTLAIALVATFVRGLFDLTNQTNEASITMNGFANQCAQAGNMFGMVVGFISGTVGGLMNIIYNVIATVTNALQYVSEFILNIFTHPINAIGRLFIDLANTIIQVLSTVAGAVDLIFNTSMSESLNRASRQLEAFKEKHLGNINSKYQKMSLKDVQGIASATAMGGNFGKNLGEIFDKSFIQQNGGLMTQLPQFKTDGNGALLVSDVNMIDIADDYRELLSKRATEKFNLQFSQVTPQVEIAGITVNNNTDLDKVFETLVDGVEEASSTSLAG